MRKSSKRQKEYAKLIDKNRAYPLAEAIELLKNASSVKFDQTVELNFDLEVDPKQSDQMVRGTVVLPHGTGKKIRIVVFCKGEAENFARDAGADHVGSTELIEKIAKGWTDFDVAVATPDMMREVGKLGRILGPRGLMPNPKAGTVSNDVAKAIGDVKGGKIEIKMDKLGNINVAIGKLSFQKEALIDNAKSVLDAVTKARPAAVKGQYIKNVYISSTMGPGIKLGF
ncbi:MAG: 50S ribosomal protein L1 [Candidatus Omnitrophota bacterium]